MDFLDAFDFTKVFTSIGDYNKEAYQTGTQAEAAALKKKQAESALADATAIKKQKEQKNKLITYSIVGGAILITGFIYIIKVRR